MTGIDLRCGAYQDVMQDVTCDLLCVDAPYSSKTHAAYSPRTDVLTACARDARWAAKGGKRRQIDYASFDESQVDALVDFWAERTRGWFVSITDDVLAPLWSSALRRHDRYVFAPLPLVELGGRVRLTGDGPSSWTCWMVIAARPRTFNKWGTLPGAYVVPAEKKMVIGGKPLDAMRAIVRDYSEPGDVVCDPCAGGATTLVAAEIEHRRAIGCEMNPETYAVAMERIERGENALKHAKQARLF